MRVKSFHERAETAVDNKEYLNMLLRTLCCWPLWPSSAERNGVQISSSRCVASWVRRAPRVRRAPPKFVSIILSCHFVCLICMLSLCAGVSISPPIFLVCSLHRVQAELGPVPAFGCEFRPAIEVLGVVQLPHDE